MPVTSFAAQLPVLREGEQRDNRCTPPLAPKMVQIAEWVGLSDSQPKRTRRQMEDAAVGTKFLW